jgi:hypothetical protein
MSIPVHSVCVDSAGRLVRDPDDAESWRPAPSDPPTAPAPPPPGWVAAAPTIPCAVECGGVILPPEPDVGDGAEWYAAVLRPGALRERGVL